MGPVAATPASPPVVRLAWAQAHIDSWTADRIPRPDLKGEAHGTTRSAPWAPDLIHHRSDVSRPIGSIDEEFNQGCHHTVTTLIPG
jgi:hypothetical protein